MTVNWADVLLKASWAAGSALIVVTWLSHFLTRWNELHRRRTMLGPIRTERKSPFRDIPFIRRLADEMEMADIRIPVEAMVGLTVFIAVAGWFAVEGSIHELQHRFALDGDRVVASNTWVLNIAVALLLGSLPYFYVKFSLQRKRHRIALDMIKLVQNVIGHYSPARTVQEMISRATDTMPDHVRAEWKRLQLSSHMHSSLEEAMYEFARRVDNGWAEDLVDILLIHHKYGNDVIDALHKLIVDMQTARKSEERRLAMVTVYRIGTCVMVAFAFMIVAFNVMADGMNYRHYFVNPRGQWLLLLSAAILFVSMILVVRSGKKTF